MYVRSLGEDSTNDDDKGFVKLLTAIEKLMNYKSKW